MNGYGTRTVAAMLGLSCEQVRSYVRSGFISPERGPRGEYQFSFQDLVFLRTARGLLEARVGPRRVRSALRKLREQLPEGRRLTGMRISAEGSRIVVGDGATRWQPESGQILLDFEVSELAEKVAPVVRSAFRLAKKEASTLSADEWYEWGYQLEPASGEDAREAYRRALERDPRHTDAHINLGRLLHETGDARAAAEHYRLALQSRPKDGTAAFNLGVALEDLGRLAEALGAYELAVRSDPLLADAHYNAAQLCEKLGESAAAVRHLKAYRQLTRDSG